MAVDFSAEPLPFELSGSFEHAPEIGGRCDASPGGAAWFTYTPSVTDIHRIQLQSASSSVNARLAVFESPSCDPYGLQMLCETSSYPHLLSNPVRLTAGTEYLFLAHSHSNSFPLWDPKIDLQPFSPGPGETCYSPVDLSTETFPFTLPGTFEYEPSLGTSCDSLPTNAAWFTYTPTVTGSYLHHPDERRLHLDGPGGFRDQCLPSLRPRASL